MTRNSIRIQETRHRGRKVFVWHVLVNKTWVSNGRRYTRSRDAGRAAAKFESQLNG
jgi:hypothetical protein